METLSKSRYTQGVICPKALYLQKRHPELQDPIDPGKEATFRVGREVGLVARGLFPGGVDASPRTPGNIGDSVGRTREAMASGAGVIYEAGFLADGLYAAVDILAREGEGWRAFEVKSATEVKDEYYTDVAFQYHVLTKAGLQVRDFSIVHLNKEYVRRGRIDLQGLFSKPSLLGKAQAMQEEVAAKVAELRAVLAADAAPDLPIGPYCDKPYRCGFHGHCWAHIPPDSVFDISKLGDAKKFALYAAGIVRLEDVTDLTALSERQRQQVTCDRERREYIDREKVAEFLGALEYPLFFMDFETIAPPIPLYDETRPYQQIPFQFSVHRMETPASKPEHFEFLAEAGPDPRPAVMRELSQVLGTKGSILVYHDSFEKPRLRELARDFPDNAARVEEILLRIVDLETPFAHRHCYSWKMRGSSSIKAVLPALVPGMSYKELAVGGGVQASEAYLELLKNPDAERRKDLRTQLLEYCALDTFGMVKILEVLRGL
ncbi:MAG: DUF2779 domain-containing protein [Bacteroidota bacterium]